MSDTIFITHPGLPKAPPSTQTREGFEKVWKRKGWQEISADEAAKINAELAKPVTAEPAAAPEAAAESEAAPTPKAKSGGAA